jgi:hypothetical protein
LTAGSLAGEGLVEDPDPGSGWLDPEADPNRHLETIILLNWGDQMSL